MGINISSNYIPAININIGMSVSGTLSVSTSSFYNVTNYQALNITKPEDPEDLLGIRLNTSSQITSYSNDNLTYIAPFTFYGCTELSTISFPSCQIISTQAFVSCTALTTANFPVCTTIGNAFQSCTSLTTANFPSCTYIGSTAFRHCHSLTSINFPVCTSTGSNAFGYCSALTSINFPACTHIGSTTFADCTSLTTASFPVCATIDAAAFQRCHNLLSLYLLGSSLCSLVNTFTFTSTPISNYTTATGGVYGSIYVPASLYNSYITATNWVTFSSRFVSV